MEENENVERLERGDELRETPNVNNGKPTIREINIQQLSHGYIIRVGCQTFAIETSEKLIQKLTAYINCPDKVEQDWKAGTFLK